MTSNATRIATHRRALAAGLTVSAAAHVVALTALSLPGGAAGARGADAPRIVDDSYEAIRVVQLAPDATVPPHEAVERIATTESQGGQAPEQLSQATMVASLDALLGELAPASVKATVPRTSRPVVTFSDLEPTAPAMMAAYGAGALEEEEAAGGGGIGGLLGRIGAALSGAGHCPTANGPLILR